MSPVTVVRLRNLVVLVPVAVMLSLSFAGCGGGGSEESPTATPESEALKAKYLETHPPPGTKPAKKKPGGRK